MPGEPRISIMEMTVNPDKSEGTVFVRVLGIGPELRATWRTEGGQPKLQLCNYPGWRDSSPECQKLATDIFLAIMMDPRYRT